MAMGLAPDAHADVSIHLFAGAPAEVSAVYATAAPAGTAPEPTRAAVTTVAHMVALFDGAHPQVAAIVHAPGDLAAVVHDGMVKDRVTAWDRRSRTTSNASVP